VKITGDKLIWKSYRELVLDIERLGLMREFIEVAADAAKIARAKHNGEELSCFAKKVGSDYSLSNRQLFCVYKQGFAALAAVAGVASAIPDNPFSPKL